MFRCLDCKEVSHWVYAEAEVRVGIRVCDGKLEYELDDDWDGEDLSVEDFRCYHCDGKVKKMGK